MSETPAPVTEWEAEYRQTPAERFDTDMNDRAEVLVTEAGGEVTGRYGGTAFGGPPDGRWAENAVVFTATEQAAHAVQAALAAALGREVTLRPVEPEPEEGRSGRRCPGAGSPPNRTGRSA